MKRHLMEGQGLQGKTESSEIKWQPQLHPLYIKNFDHQTVNAVRTTCFDLLVNRAFLKSSCVSLFPHHPSL